MSDARAEVAEILRKWDAGESIWSIEMGGLGPGYEQAIQVLAVEIMRDNLHGKLPKTLLTFGDATVSRIDKQDPTTGKYSCGGFSGAQVGAAKQIAYKFLDKGPEAAMDSAPSDRRIQVSNFWPKVTA